MYDGTSTIYTYPALQYTQNMGTEFKDTRELMIDGSTSKYDNFSWKLDSLHYSVRIRRLQFSITADILLTRATKA